MAAAAGGGGMRCDSPHPARGRGRPPFTPEQRAEIRCPLHCEACAAKEQTFAEQGGRRGAAD
eukprot:gene1236-358_t